MILSDIFVFVFLFVSCFLWHEFFHSFELWRQGFNNYSIYIDFDNLSMRTNYTTIDDERLLFLSGGLYTCILLFLLSMVSVGVWQFSFYTLGWVQLIYGLFEYRYRNHIRWDYRVILYLVIILVNMLIWWWI